MTPPLLLMTFDDRTVDHWFDHRGVLEDADAHATFFVSGVDELTEDETEKLQALQRDGHTVGSHGLHHVDGPAYVTAHGLAAFLANEITPSIAGLRERGLGHRDYAHPFGRHDHAVDRGLSSRFSWVRATSPRYEDQRATQVLVDLEDPSSRVLPARGVDVGRRGSANTDDGETLLAVLDEAARTGTSVCLYAHDIAEWDEGLAQGRNFITPTRFREVLTAATERGLRAAGTGVLPD